MSGHSKWSTIKRAKGAADIKRGLTFTKIANAITIATKIGGSGDPESNPRLRMAMEEAKTVNMPKDNVQRAIDRGLGKLEGGVMEEVFYEGFGPSKVAFIVECVTDNKLRTLQEVKNIFEKNGGVLAKAGAVSYMFDRVGEIKVRGQRAPEGEGDREQEMLQLIDLGAEDVEDFLEPFDSAQGKDIQMYLVYTEAINVAEVGTKITQAGYALESQQLVFKANIMVEITNKEEAEKVLEFAGKLEELDDVQKVYANFNIDEKLISS